MPYASLLHALSTITLPPATKGQHFTLGASLALFPGALPPGKDTMNRHRETLMLEALDYLRLALWLMAADIAARHYQGRK